MRCEKFTSDSAILALSMNKKKLCDSGKFHDVAAYSEKNSYALVLFLFYVFDVKFTVYVKINCLSPFCYVFVLIE